MEWQYNLLSSTQEDFPKMWFDEYNFPRNVKIVIDKTDDGCELYNVSDKYCEELIWFWQNNWKVSGTITRDLSQEEEWILAKNLTVLAVHLLRYDVKLFFYQVDLTATLFYSLTYLMSHGFKFELDSPGKYTKHMEKTFIHYKKHLEGVNIFSPDIFVEYVTSLLANNIINNIDCAEDE